MVLYSLRKFLFFAMWSQTAEDLQPTCPFPIIASLCGVVHVDIEKGFLCEIHSLLRLGVSPSVTTPGICLCDFTGTITMAN